MDYYFRYKQFKRLPAFLSALSALAFFVWSIVDVCVFQVKVYKTIRYGIMGIENLFLALLVWWLIGAIVAFVEYLISTILISPAVISTDTLIYLREQKEKEINAKRLINQSEKTNAKKQ